LLLCLYGRKKHQGLDVLSLAATCTWSALLAQVQAEQRIEFGGQEAC